MARARAPRADTRDGTDRTSRFAPDPHSPLPVRGVLPDQRHHLGGGGAAAFYFDRLQRSNAPKVAGRHGVAPGECEQALFQELFVVFTVRGEMVRVLAARDMSRKERASYAKITARQKDDPAV